MRSSHALAVLAVAGACLLSAPLYAASPADYLAQRDDAQLMTVDPSQPLTSQFDGNAGKQVEVDGEVSGIISSRRSGFLLRDADGDALVIFSNDADPDIAVGHHLRVLALVPRHGTTLYGVAVTNAGGRLHQRVRRATANVGVNTVTPAADDATPDSYTTPETPSGTVDLSAADNTVTPMDDTAPIDAALRAKVLLYAAKIRHFNSHIGQETANQIAYGVLVKCPLYGVDPRLIFALLVQESRFNPHAVSRVGACGLGQLMPQTAAKLGVRDSFDIYDNLDGSIRYLKQQLDTFNGDYRLALAAYNAGPAAVIRHNGIPPFAETVNYVRVISTNYETMTQTQSL